MPVYPYHSPHDTIYPTSTTQLVPRDSSPGGGLPTSTIIAIAVACGCVAVLIFSLFLWRLLVRLCRPNRSAPLPPVQPLAHQREQQLAAFSGRDVVTPASWHEGSLRAPLYLPSTNSDVSLFPSGTPKDSLYADELATAESTSTLPSPQPNSDIHLPPRLAFPASPISVTPSDSDSLRGTTSASDTFGTLSPSESVPHSETTSSAFSAASSTHPLVSLHSQTPSPSRSARSRSTTRGWQSRPTSMVSYAGSNFSHASRPNSTLIRGAPHSIHSNVQIILPTPLAPQLSPYGFSPDIPGTPSRSSVYVDRWVNVGSPTDEKSGDSNTPRIPSSWNNQRRNHRRSLPVELPSSRSSRGSPSPVASRRMTQQAPPPVPRLPSEYNIPFVKQEIEMDSEPERGRPRFSRPPSLSLSEKPSAASLQEGKPKTRTLKKARPDMAS